MSLVESTSTNIDYEVTKWYEFKCLLPLEVLRRLEDELERIKILAEINRDHPDKIQDGLAMEYLVALSSQTPDESVV